MENLKIKKLKDLSQAALLIASATFTACSSDDNIIDEQPVQPSQQVYTMAIEASKGDAATTRALALDGKTLNATWATSENVYVQKGDTWADGSLQPQTDGATATLKGELSGIDIEANDNLTLQFPRSGALDYTGQVGTLADIAAKYDYATATVTVDGISATGNIIPKEATTTFQNQQAIVKFTLKDKDNSGAAISATALTVSDGTNTYTVTPASATSEIYVAIPGFSGQTVTLTATVGDDTYTYEKTGVTFANGQYYEITVKMKKQLGHTLAGAAIGDIVGTDGLAYSVADKDDLPSGVTAQAVVAYKDGASGLALALEDVSSNELSWNTEGANNDGKTAAEWYAVWAEAHSVAGCTWHIPTKDEWTQLWPAEGNFSARNTAITNAGGTRMADTYWTSTEYDDLTSEAWTLNVNYPSAIFDEKWKYNTFNVRACIAF